MKKVASIRTENKGSRAQRLASVVSGANKAFKKSIIHNPRDESFLVVPRISTGLYGLDAATNGGLPVGRITMAYGPQGSGKTSLFLRSVGDAQKRCANCYKYGTFEPGEMEVPDLSTGKTKMIETNVISGCPCGNPRDMVVLWVDAENAWETSWSERLGVDAEKVMLVKPSYGEQAYDLISAFVSMKDVDIIAIDSLAQLTPIDEMNSDMGEQFQGLAARMNNRFLRKVVSGMCDAFNENRPITLWAVNQYRQKIGVMFGSPDVLPGGMGQKFATSLEIECRKGKITMDDDTGEALLGDFKWTVKKNKVGTEGSKGVYQQCMSDMDLFSIGDLMEHESVIDKAVLLGFMDKPNNVMYEFDGEKFRGKGQVVKFFAESPKVYEDLKTEMLRVRLGLSGSPRKDVKRNDGLSCGSDGDFVETELPQADFDEED